MKLVTMLLYAITGCLLTASPASAMHVMEGFLPKEQALMWLLLLVPFLLAGARAIGRVVRHYPERKLLLGLAGAFIFVLSALKIPSVTGSSSHATGIGLSAVLFGPSVSSVLSGIVLAFQTLLLAHGGITTWGANTFSMGVAGAFTGWAVFRLTRKLGSSDSIAMFLAAFTADMATYLVTAGQLAAAFPDSVGGYGTAWLKFSGVFAFTQLPLAVSEGLVSVVVYNALVRYADQGLITLWWKKESTKP